MCVCIINIIIESRLSELGDFRDSVYLETLNNSVGTV